MSTSSAVELVRSSLGGDLNAFSSLLNISPNSVDAIAEVVPSFRLTHGAVKRVLVALQNNEVQPSLVQQWASFIREGYFGSTNMPRTPLDIEYEDQFEDQIATAISRLDELGDSVDGTISKEEIQGLVNSM
jgi:hypothetical protein